MKEIERFGLGNGWVLLVKDMGREIVIQKRDF